MIIPIGDRVLVEQQKKENKSCIILDTESEDSMKIPRGTVVAIGNDVNTGYFVVGDVVFFNEYSGERLQYEEKEHLLLRTSEIIAKVAL